MISISARRTGLVAAAALTAALLLSPAVAEPTDMEVRKLKVKAPNKQSRRSFKLRFDFPRGPWADNYDLERDGIAMSFEGETVFSLFDASLEPAGDGAKVRKPNRFKWQVKARRPGTSEKLKLTCDVALGRLVASGKGFHMTELLEKFHASKVLQTGPAAVDVLVTMGGQEFAATIDMHARKGTWKLRPADAPRPKPNPGGGGGGGQTGPLQGKIIAQGSTSSWKTGIETVARNHDEFWQAWAQIGLKTALAPDWETEMVAIVALSDRPTGGYTVGNVVVNALEGGGTRVDYVEGITQGSCAVTQAFTQPWIMVSVPRVDGPDTFSKSTAINICHGSP